MNILGGIFTSTFTFFNILGGVSIDRKKPFDWKSEGYSVDSINAQDAERLRNEVKNNRKAIAARVRKHRKGDEK